MKFGSKKQISRTNSVTRFNFALWASEIQTRKAFGSKSIYEDTLLCDFCPVFSYTEMNLILFLFLTVFNDNESHEMSVTGQTEFTHSDTSWLS